MSISTNQVALLAVMVSFLVPLLVEAVKKRFGKEDQKQKADHDKHGEIMAELTAERTALAATRTALTAAEKSESEWRAKYQEKAERVLALLQEMIDKDLLIGKLTDCLSRNQAEYPRNNQKNK